VIPVATTTVTALRGSEPEPGEGITFETLATGVRAVIGSPGGAERPAPGGGASVLTSRAQVDPIPGVTLTHTDVLLDEVTGLTYEIDTVVERVGFGMEHSALTVHTVTGVAV
jgi:hypothetical protein